MNRLRRGFSLLEMLVAAFIALFIFTIGFIMITGTVRARGESLSRVHAAENARLFFQMLENDLSSAYPGPYGMTKGMQPVPGSNPATLVLNEAAPVASDLIQFYTNNDLSVENPAIINPERKIFVRYYVNQQEHTMCRDVQEDNSGSTPLETAYFTTTAIPDQHALFDEARQILIDYQYWDNAAKTMKPLPGQPRLTWNGTDFFDGSGVKQIPTHLTVTVVLFDQFAEARLKNDMTANPNPNLKYRAFTKTFPIPPGFK